MKNIFWRGIKLEQKHFFSKFILTAIEFSKGFQTCFLEQMLRRRKVQGLFWGIKVELIYNFKNKINLTEVWYPGDTCILYLLSLGPLLGFFFNSWKNVVKNGAMDCFFFRYKLTPPQDLGAGVGFFLMGTGGGKHYEENWARIFFMRKRK